MEKISVVLRRFLLDKKEINVFECIKDSYNNPYIPGSSLKGMLRTILLSYMAHNAEECEKWGWHINGAMREYKGPNKFLKEQIGEIETSIFIRFKGEMREVNR